MATGSGAVGSGAAPPWPFRAVLVANRGEIAVRIFATVRRLGLRSIAVYTAADSQAAHLGAADLAAPIGSYLSIEDVVAAAAATGADAVHPGYGFLSERPAMAEAVQRAGLTWIGPPPAAMALMGDKITAKAAVASAGVPVVPGVSGADVAVDDFVASAAAVGFPLLLKPSAGGGGKGMRRVEDRDGLEEAVAGAAREAVAAFGDGTLLAERWISRPRHIEVQVFADRAGATIHLGERECSLQRRHQKIVEECPSPLLDPATREAMGASAVACAQACGYVGAGTVEFIVSGDDPGRYYFMEMNTRLQVEHPVTEMVAGQDLVEWQLRVAAGEPLPLRQDQVTLSGHAVEARLYAEDPARGFLPSAGPLLYVRLPGDGLPGVRVDSGIAAGAAVPTGFDPMLAKIVAWAPDRIEALRRLDAALAATCVLGVATNSGLLRRLLAHPDVQAGRLDTELVERVAGAVAPPPPDLTERACIAAAMTVLAGPQGGAAGAGHRSGPWDRLGGWRMGAPPAPARQRLRVGERTVETWVSGPAAAAEVGLDGGPGVAAGASWAAGELTLTTGGVRDRWAVASGPAGSLWLGQGGDSWRVTPVAQRLPRAAGETEAGPVLAPMPGTVLAVHVRDGEPVTAGQRVLTVEAMKMEHVVTAPGAGVIRQLRVGPGAVVALDEVLAMVEPDDGSALASADPPGREHDAGEEPG